MSSGFGFLGLCRVALHFRDVVAVGQAESFTVTRNFPHVIIDMQLLVNSLMYCDGPTLEAVLTVLPPFPPTPPPAGRLLSLFNAREPVICSLYMNDGSILSMTEPGFISFVLASDFEALSVRITGEDVEFR